MIQPIKQFRVTRLTISGFKGYADQKTFQFGGMNVISGHMGVGKSSIADAIPRPDLRFRHPGRVLSGDRRCPQADDERKQPHQRPGQGQRGTGLSGIYPGRRQPACAGTDPDKREFFHAAQQRRHLLYFGGIPDPRPGLRTGRISKEAIK